MQFLTFYTPAPGAHSGPPSKEYMDQMNKLIEGPISADYESRILNVAQTSLRVHEMVAANERPRPFC